jgi:drug/metabolite transporter (DMT)-like permease
MHIAPPRPILPADQARRARMRLDATGWAMLSALSLLWGGSFLFGAIAVVEVPPLTLAWARVAVAAVALAATAALVGVRLPRDGASWRRFALMGLLNNAIPFSLIFWGQTRLGAGIASILNATTPLFTVLVAHVATADERLTPARLAGVLAGLAGVATMLAPALEGGFAGPALADLACAAAAFSYALAGVYGRRFRDLPALVPATGQLAASAVLLAPAAGIAAMTMPGFPSATAASAVLALALASTALAYLLYFRILARAGATNLLLVTFLIPASAITLGIVLLGERLALRHWLGLALIGLGLAAIDGRPAVALRAARGRAG